jgi:hypothetical protein
MTREMAVREITDAVLHVRSIELDDRLRRHGWSRDLIERMSEYFETLSDRITNGWTPRRADEVNMGMWFDSEGITPYEDDELKTGFRTAANVIRELAE